MTAAPVGTDIRVSSAYAEALVMPTRPGSCLVSGCFAVLGSA